MPKLGRTHVICFLLAAITLALYWPVTTYPFIHTDDHMYVIDNTNIHGGVNKHSIQWAFEHFYAGNWHPLTWISHALDIQLFGGTAGGHHLTNIILHAANTVLLFLVLLRLVTSQSSGASEPVTRHPSLVTFQCALVAALFAWHPLHVESVAWISERKDVLSTFFFLLTLWSYSRYVELRQSQLLNSQTPKLLDSSISQTPKLPNSPPQHPLPWYILSLLLFACGLLSKGMLVTLPFVLLLLDYWPLKRLDPAGLSIRGIGEIRGSALLQLVVEKLPFFVLTIIACMATVWAQQVAIMDVGAVPILQRIGNVFVSYALYLRKAFWPSDLALFYYRWERSPLEILLAAAVLLAISAVVLWQWRKRPYLLVGWCWFLGTLVPVIGLVQVGYQSMADRYTYIPLIGIFIMVAWGVPDLLESFKSQVPGLKSNALTGCAMGTGAAVICGVLLTLTHTQIGYWRSPIAMIMRCMDVEGPMASLENDLGSQYEEQGDLEQAAAHYRRAVTTPSADNLEVLRQPQVRARINLGGVLAAQGKFEEAANEFQTALKEMPEHWQARSNLGDCLLALGQVDEAVKQFQWASRTGGRGSPIVWHRLGIALNRAGKSEEALKAYRQSVRLKPEGWEELNDLAWFLATDPHPELRDGPEAVKLAQKAVELTNGRAPQCLGTLDAAYAEAGKFEEAIGTAHQAQELALAARQMDLVGAAGDRIELYKQQKPFHLPKK